MTAPNSIRDPGRRAGHLSAPGCSHDEHDERASDQSLQHHSTDPTGGTLKENSDSTTHTKTANPHATHEDRQPQQPLGGLRRNALNKPTTHLLLPT
jgi:hypothetical protein